MPNNRYFNVVCLVAFAVLTLAAIVTVVMTAWEKAVNWPTGAFVLAMVVFAALTWKRD
jgi:hypothetical protein